MKILNKPIILLSFIIFSGFIAAVNLKADNSNYTKLKEQLQAILNKSIKDTKTKGVIACVVTPDFHWISAAGNSGNGKLKSTDMLRLASMTKTFVSVVVQKLCEEGKLKLDDNISEYLPPKVIKNIPNASTVTVRQLLDMTSGIISYTEIDEYNDAVDSNPHGNPWTPEKILEYVYWEKRASFAPGKGWEYSNTNYILLEMIVKEATGKSLASEMRRTIFTPLRLNNIFMEIQEPGKEGFGGLFVRGHDKEGKDITEIQDGLGLGDGGLISNADNVAQFMDALFIDKELLDDSSLKQMTIFHPAEDYGLGLELRKTKFGNFLGHSGGSSGFESDMLYLPEKEMIFVVLTNQEDTGICDIVFQRIMEVLLKKKTTVKLF